MKRFEHTHFVLNVGFDNYGEHQTKFLEDEGWELVTAITLYGHLVMYFKREVPKPKRLWFKGWLR